MSDAREGVLDITEKSTAMKYQQYNYLNKTCITMDVNMDAGNFIRAFP